MSDYNLISEDNVDNGETKQNHSELIVTQSSSSTDSSDARRLLLLCDTSEAAGAATLKLRQTIDSELRQTLEQQPNVILVENVENATHALVILTGQLRDGSQLLLTMNQAVELLPASNIVYMYSEEAGWDFGAFYGRPESLLKSSITDHEALKYRPLVSSTNNEWTCNTSYEHKATVSEMLRRLLNLKELSDQNVDHDDYESIKMFRWLMLFVSVFPVWSVLVVAFMNYFLGNKVCWFGVYTFLFNLVPMMAASTVAQILVNIKQSVDYMRFPMNWFEIVNASHLIVVTVAGLGFQPYLILPTNGWWYFACPAFTLGSGIIFFVGVKYALPSAKSAVQGNLTTKRALHDFHVHIMFMTACALIFNFFIFTYFIFPAITTDDLVSAYSGTNRTKYIYHAGIPTFVEFAVPNYWYHLGFSTLFGVLMIFQVLSDGMGVIKAAKSTGTLNNKLMLLSIAVFLVVLLGFLTFAGVLAQNIDRKLLMYMSPLESLRSTFSHKFLFLFFSVLTVGQIIGISIILILVLQLSTLIKQMQSLKDGNEWHFFLSHYQQTGGDQCAVLSSKLKEKGLKVWYDNEMKKLTAEGMKDGVCHAAVFVLFMSKGVFSRPFVQLEIKEALRVGKPILLLHEIDERHGKFDFDTKCTNKDGKDMVPIEFQLIAKKLLNDNESIGWERRDFKQEAVLNEIKERFLKIMGDQSKKNK